MGPRSKQSRNELILCDICGCLFTNKDASIHKEKCTDSKPFKITFMASSADDNCYYCQGCPHGLLLNQILIGKVEELSIKDVPDHFPKNSKGRMLQLNPVIMKHLQISIGKPVILNGAHVYDAWPCSTIPATTVKITRAIMEDTACSLQTIMVQALEGPEIDASTIHCKIRDIVNDIKLEQMADYIVGVSVGRFVTSGSRLKIDYYGQPCEVSISVVDGVDDSCVNSQYLDDSSLLDSISEEVGRLNLTSDEPQSASTPVKCNKQLSRSSYSENITRFYRISRSTKLIIMDEQLPNSDERSTGPTLKDFGGFHEQIETIKDAMSSHLFKSEILALQGLSSPGGMLLYGPSGSGKTMLVQAISKEFPVHLMTINGSEVWSKFYGESEAKLAAMMREAQARAPSIVFLDEIDALCPKRENTKNEVERRVVATLLTIIDGLAAGKKRVFILAATNKRQDIDSAMRRPGRLDREIELGVPSVEDRLEILQKLVHRTGGSISEEVLRDIAERAHGFLGADLAAVCKEATLHALKKVMKQGKDDTDGFNLGTDDLRYGFQMVKPSAMKEVTLEVSKVSWSDIGGQEDLKHKLRQAVEWPLKHPEAFTRLGIRPPRGLLMYGPPGCSKTMIAKALAKESGLNFIAIKGPELFSKWVGESERAVREVFHRARAAAPAIVFFDEIDALAGERGGHGGGGGDVSDRVLAQLLTEMDGVQALEDILVVAATNRPDRIDKALMRPGRLDRIVYVPLPDETTRHAIFSIHCKKTPVALDVNIDELVNHTQGYSGAEVSAVCNEAALAALQEDIHNDCVHNRHFTAALNVIKPRITPQLISLYDKYSAQGAEIS